MGSGCEVDPDLAIAMRAGNKGGQQIEEVACLPAIEHITRIG